MAWFGAANPARRIPANVHVATVCVGLLFYSGIGGANPEGSKAFLDVRTILDAWEANYGSIRSMKVAYSVKINEKRGPESAPLKRSFQVARIEDGKRYHIAYSEAEQGLADKNSVVQSSFDGQATKLYMAMRRLGRIDAGLQDTTYASTNDVQRLMMMKRVVIPAWKEEYPEGAPWFSVLLRDDPGTRWSKVLPELEQVGGEPCHVIERHRPGDANTDKLWVAHGKGMLLMRHEVIRDGKVIRRLEMRTIASVMTDVGEFWYPREIHHESSESGQVEWELTVDEFVPHVTIPPGTFDVHFPHGTFIADHIAGTEYLQN